jgi:hypothetical protein
MTPTPITALSFNDTGAVTPAGALPGANTSLPQLSQVGILTPPGQIVVKDLTTGMVLLENYDYTLTASGGGPSLTYTVSQVADSTDCAPSDSISVSYWWFAGSSIVATFTQGLVPNTALIYKPSGATYSQQGYQFAVAAGNRAGLSNYSAWSSYVIPLNTNAVPTGSLDPANTVNPIYNPAGAVQSGTGLGA